MQIRQNVTKSNVPFYLYDYHLLFYTLSALNECNIIMVTIPFSGQFPFDFQWPWHTCADSCVRWNCPHQCDARLGLHDYVHRSRCTKSVGRFTIKVLDTLSRAIYTTSPDEWVTTKYACRDGEFCLVSLFLLSAYWYIYGWNFTP